MAQKVFQIVPDPKNPGIDELLGAYKGAYSNKKLHVITLRTNDPLYPRLSMLVNGLQYAERIESQHFIKGLLLLNEGNRALASGFYNTETKEGNITVEL